jgi:hypothetical protein
MNMTCDDCDFHPDRGGNCRGLIKNPAAKVPFYVCPHAEDMQIIQEYLDRTATNRASSLVPLVSSD